MDDVVIDRHRNTQFQPALPHLPMPISWPGHSPRHDGVNGTAIAGSELTAPQLAGHPTNVHRPIILLTTTLNLNKTARLAIALADLNCNVATLCPPGHCVRSTRRIWRSRHYGALQPLRALDKAIRDLRPDLIIPCDDRALRHMHLLHRSASDPFTRANLERSLGSAENFACVEARLDFLLRAKREGLLVPHTRAVHCVADLYSWGEQQPFPWVLKADGTWGGVGVRIVNSLAEAEKTFQELRRPAKAQTVLSFALFEWDFFWLAPWLSRTRPALSVQRYVGGTAANCAVACWNGEVLASVAVETVIAESSTGPSCVVRVVEGAAMHDAAARMIGALRMTGLVGFDFMIEQGTDKTYLIEMNARAVPLSHIPFGADRDAARALVSKLTGEPNPVRSSIPTQDLIAYFPDLWRLDPTSPLLARCYHDVPWDAPELVRDLLRPAAPRARRFLHVNLGRVRHLGQRLTFRAGAILGGSLLAARRNHRRARDR